jgi:HEAT repeats
LPASSEHQDEYFKVLCKLLQESEDPLLRAKTAQSLGKLGKWGNTQVIEILIEVLLNDRDRKVRITIIDILDEIIPTPPDTPMSDPPQNQPIFNIQQVGNINTGDLSIQGDQVGIQYNIEQSEDISHALREIQKILDELRQQHPQASETAASAIIDAEFREIRRKQPWQWQNLLSLKRLWKGSKTAAFKVSEHLAEDSVWGKGFLGFLEGVSEDED